MLAMRPATGTTPSPGSNGSAAGSANALSSVTDSMFEAAADCAICDKKFHAFRRKHRCRSCGHAVCGNCARNHKIMPSSFLVRYNNEPVRVCDRCIKGQTQLMQERRRMEDIERARARQQAALQDERISRMVEQARLDQLLAEQLEIEERQKATRLRQLELHHFGARPERSSIRRRRSMDDSIAIRDEWNAATAISAAVAKTAPKDLDVFIVDAEKRSLEILDLAGVKPSHPPSSQLPVTAMPTMVREATVVSEVEDECAICLETMEAGNAIYTTACGHSFHWRCLKDIQKSDVSNADKCPSCRATMEEMQVKKQCDHPRVRLGHRYCRDCGSAVTERDAKPRPNDDGTPSMGVPNGGVAPPPPQQPTSYRAGSHGALVRCPQCQIQMRVLPHMYNMRVACPSGHMFLVQVAGQGPAPGGAPAFGGRGGGRAPPARGGGYPGTSYYRSTNYSEL